MSRTIRLRVYDFEQKKMYELGYINLESHAYDDFPVMEFTGLYDKNDKEIWEGDILSYGKYTGHFADINKDCLHEVRWDDDHARFITIELLSGEEFSSLDNYDAEIIGNIYQNQELVKQ